MMPMPPASLSGRAGRGAGRLFAQRKQIGQNLGRASLAASRRFLAHAGSVLRQLGLQMSGIVFLLFAFSFGFDGLRKWRHLPPHSTSHTPLFEGGIALLLLYFGVSSFLRAAQSRH